MSYSHMEIAEIFVKTGELEDALDELNKQLSETPQDDYVLRMRASVLLRLAQPTHLQDALIDLNSLTNKTDNDYTQQSVIYERLNQMTDAISSMQKAVELAPDHERTLERLIELLIHEKQYITALKNLESAPQTWRWLMRQADIFTLNNQPENALSTLNNAEKNLQIMFPDLLAPVSRNTMAQIHIARGQVHMVLEDYSSAEKDFTDALYYIPDDASIEFNLGLVYALTDRLDLAVKKCTSALKKTTPFVRQTLLDALNEDERYTKLKEKLVST